MQDFKLHFDAIINMGTCAEIEAVRLAAENAFTYAVKYQLLTSSELSTIVDELIKPKYNNHASALYLLGLINWGITPKNYQQAIQFFEEAIALNRHSNALVRRAYMYVNGEGCKTDYSEAIKLYEEAIKQNNSDAMCNRGLMYLKGQRSAPDQAKAIALYRQAIELGNTKAMYNLASITGDAALNVRAAELGFPAAMTFVTSAFIQGKIDYQWIGFEKAMHFCKQAIERHSAEAMFYYPYYLKRLPDQKDLAKQSAVYYRQAFLLGDRTIRDGLLEFISKKNLLNIQPDIAYHYCIMSDNTSVLSKFLPNLLIPLIANDHLLSEQQQLGYLDLFVFSPHKKFSMHELDANSKELIGLFLYNKMMATLEKREVNFLKTAKELFFCIPSETKHYLDACINISLAIVGETKISGKSNHYAIEAARPYLSKVSLNRCEIDKSHLEFLGDPISVEQFHTVEVSKQQKIINKQLLSACQVLLDLLPPPASNFNCFFHHSANHNAQLFDILPSLKEGESYD